jgi:hypothetical protein
MYFDKSSSRDTFRGEERSRDLSHVAVLVKGFAAFVRNSAGIDKAQGFATDVADKSEHSFTVFLTTN